MGLLCLREKLCYSYLKNLEKMLLEELLTAVPPHVYIHTLSASFRCDKHTFPQTQDAPFHDMSFLVIK